MFAAVCLDASPPSSHRFISSLVLDCVPPHSAFLGSCLSPLRPVIDVGACAAAVPLLHATRPASSTRRAGRHDGAVAASSALLACPLSSPSHPCGSASDGDGARCLPRYIAPPASALWTSSVPPANRSLAQSDFLVVLPPHRLISPITRHGERGGASWSRLLVFAVLFRLLSICVGSVYCGGGGCLTCLNGVYLFLSVGDVVARRCVSGL